jgi:MerR family transcriptional regulator, light-induced transcriptional regulator
MKEEIQYFNSHDAAKILGVNVSTIKRWTDEGKLECIKSIGGHRKFMMDHFTEFLGKNNKKVSKINVFPIEADSDLEISHHILKGNFEFLIDYVLEQAFLSNRNRVQYVMNGLYLSQYPLHEIFDNLITHVLYKIGDLWEQDDKTITEEHIATQTIRDSIVRLQGIIRIPQEKIGQALCLNLSNEMHDIALKMVDHILEIKGYQVLFSGQITPILKMDHVLQTFKPERIYISSTIIDNVDNSQTEFDEICQMSESHNASVIVGGQGFDLINHDQPAVKSRLISFEELYNSD